MGDWIYYKQAKNISIYTCLLIALYGLVAALCFNPLNWYGIVIASLFILYDIIIFFKRSWNFHCCTREMATRIFLPCTIVSIISGVVLSFFFDEGFMNCWSIGLFSAGVLYLMITIRLFKTVERGWYSRIWIGAKY